MENVPQIMSFLCKIHKDYSDETEMFYFDDRKIEALFHEIQLSYKEIVTSLSIQCEDIKSVTVQTSEWKFLILNFHCLHLLASIMKKDDLLSITQAKYLRNFLTTIVKIGISQNLNPKLPHYKPSEMTGSDIKTQYYMLRASTSFLFEYAMTPSMRYYTLPYILQDLLVASFQLSFCPVKKPNTNVVLNEFIMTEEFYTELLKDQKRFTVCLETIRNSVCPPVYLKEIMMLFQSNSPNWFKKAVCATLTNSLKSDGLENILRTMLAGIYDNNTSIWRVVDVMAMIIVKCSNSHDYEQCIRPQIISLLKTDEDVVAFEKLYASVVKTFYSIKKEEAKLLLDNVFSILSTLSNDCNLSSRYVQRAIRVIHNIFLDTKDVSISTQILTPIVIILFKIYTFLTPSSTGIKSDIHDILVKFLKDSDRNTLFSFFECAMFNNNSPLFEKFNKNLRVSVRNSYYLQITSNHDTEQYNFIEASHSIYSLCNSNSELFLIYFGFLLSCLSGNKYFSDISLLENEDEGCLSVFGKKIAVYEMLNICSVDGMKNKFFDKKVPDEIFEYFEQVFLDAIKNGTHKNPNDSSYQIFFTVLLILKDFMRNQKYNFNSELVKLLRIIHEQASDDELKILTTKLIENSEVGCEAKTDDEIEEIVKDIYDESIPLKGHGLIALGKLVSSRHSKVVEKKQYIFTIFKENLSNRDTYIYQSAIKGLASMSDLGAESTNLVLETLCDEYTDFHSEEFGTDSNEMKLKIGEILVQISRKLGEMAPKYKALLLNTFLNGTKNEDHLVRASALANLGEICKVLGYKLGSIITEILLCVHAIINTDKHPESRRAAVSVIRNLLAGLGPDMLEVLRDDISIIYKTLKLLHKNNDDDVLALQAQLALEEINENMKNIILPKIQLDKIHKEVVLK